MNGLTIVDLTVDGPHDEAANRWVRGLVCDRCLDGTAVTPGGLCEACENGSTDSIVAG